MNKFSKQTCLVILVYLSAIAVGGPKNLTGAADKKTAKQSKVTDSPDVKELLRRFAEARENFTSFIVECESENTFNNPQLNRSGERYAKVEYRFDGTRSRVRVFWWGNVDIRSPNVSEDQAHYSSELWDGESRYWYTRTSSGPGLVILRRAEDPGGIPKEETDIIKGKNIVGEMMGYHWGDNGKRVDEILDIAEYLELRKNKKKLRGVDCYVIDAVVKGRGKYKLWIDPIHDYHIAKIHVWRKEGDYVHTRMAKKNQSTNEMYEILRFQKIGDLWFPLEYKMERTIIDNGRLSKEDKTTKITNIVLNPDHDALKSFIPNDIPNGATANIVAFPPSMEFIWQDGKVVDKTGRVIMDFKPKKPAGSAAEHKPKSQNKKHPTAFELLDKYTEALDSTESFIASFESVDKFSYHVLGYTPRLIGAKMFRRGQNRSDGRRKYFREYQWGDFNAQLRNLSKDTPHYNCRVIDDKKSYAHARLVNDPRSRGSVSCWEGTKKEVFSRNTTNSHILGFMGSDERLDTVLRRASQISVRPTTETIGGSDCYVIDAHTKYGKYSLCLDPEHGYHPIKINRRATEGDEHFDKGVLSKGHIRTAYLDNVRFEKIDGVWVPMEADRGYDKIFGHPGSFSKGDIHFERTKIVLNPDHDKLGSFDNPLENPDQDPELVNGTKVRIVGDKARYTWRDGKLIPDKDRAKPKPKQPPRPSR